MPTTKHRISITPDEELFDALEALSKKRGRALSSVSLELIKRAMEFEEDFHFSKVADERLAKKEQRIPHSRAWR